MNTSIGKPLRNNSHHNRGVTDVVSSNIKNVMHKHNGTNQKNTEIVKRASNCAKRKTHHLIVVVVTNGKEKKHSRLINAVHTPRKLECA